MTTVVSFEMPEEDINSSNWLCERMSLHTVSQSWVFQAHAIAFGMWPSSYAFVSTSTSTTLTFGSEVCPATQSVDTNTSGCA